MNGIKIQTILCPTDFSDLSTFALEHARELARCSQARLVVMHADMFMPPPYFTAFQVEELNETMNASRKGLAAQLSEYVQQHVPPSSNVKADWEVVESPPIPAILQTAEKVHADLIVMGTHGRSGFTRVMLGSVTERILRETDRPVMTVRHKQGSEHHPFAIRQVLCPYNFSDVARDALQFALAWAGCFQSKLTLLHVAETAEVSEDALQEQFTRACESIPESLRQQCAIEQVVIRHHGNPAEQIVKEAVARGVDLIVLGGQHKRFIDSTVIGTTTVRVTRHAPCPVVTVIRKGSTAVPAA